MAKRKRKRGRRKIYKKKSSAKRAKRRAQCVYKVKGGWSIGKGCSRKS